jgi:hypothetical protein
MDCIEMDSGKMKKLFYFFLVKVCRQPIFENPFPNTYSGTKLEELLAVNVYHWSLSSILLIDINRGAVKYE